MFDFPNWDPLKNQLGSLFHLETMKKSELTPKNVETLRWMGVPVEQLPEEFPVRVYSHSNLPIAYIA